MRRLLPSLILATLLVAAQDVPPSGGVDKAEVEGTQHLPGLTEGQTQSLAVRYERAEHWALRGFVLLALGERWHPLGAEMVLDALGAKERGLRVYALECLVRTDPDALRTVATAELVAELARVQVREKHKAYAGQVELILKRLFPGAEVKAALDWSRVWSSASEGWATEPWIPPPPPKGDGRTAAMGGVERAFDLHEAGLDLCICIDTTGSMQATIDAARDSVDDLVDLLEGIAPKFRLGLVEYKDYVDMPEGARLLESLSNHPDRVKKKLARTVAKGGGDFPEAVEAGLRVAFDEDVGWQHATNKLVVVFGDAPPKDTDLAVELAKGALTRPFGLDPSDVSSRSRRSRTVLRPIVTAAVACGSREVQRSTEKSFMRLAQAGGGAYAQLLTQHGGEDPAPEPASEAIARHVLTLAFGARWQSQVEAFVGVYMTYHRNGFLR